MTVLEDEKKLRGLPWMVALTQGVGIAMVVMIGVWLNSYLGGFAWDGTSKEFNLHPLCMVCGIIFIYGEAAVSYRVFRNSEKLKVKLIHVCLLLLAFFATVVGLVSVFQFHNAQGIPNMYTLHSWCGMATVILFSFQLTLGFLAYLLPGARRSIRIFYMPIHRFFGSIILMLAGFTAVSGINEKLFFVYTGKEPYKALPGGAVFGNLCGFIIIVFIIMVLYILQKTDWKRPSDPEEEAVSVHFRTLTAGESDSD